MCFIIKLSVLIFVLSAESGKPFIHGRPLKNVNISRGEISIFFENDVLPKKLNLKTFFCANWYLPHQVFN